MKRTIITIALVLSPSLTLAVCGDLNGSGTLSASDALAALKAAVGQEVVLECPAPSAVRQTGQTTCYNAAGVEVGCAGTGNDGDLQRGVVRSFVDNGDGTISDNATGLMWEKLSNDGSVHDKDNTYTWASAFMVKVATLNYEAFATHTDWRMPSRFELETLVNLGVANPATFLAFNSACTSGCTPLTCSCTPQDSRFWSSSTAGSGEFGYAWYVDFSWGVVAEYNATQLTRVRAVRGGL